MVHECEIYEGGSVLELGNSNFQTSENILPKQYASHDDKEFLIEHWYTQPAFHKRTAVNGISWPAMLTIDACTAKEG